MGFTTLQRGAWMSLEPLGKGGAVLPAPPAGPVLFNQVTPAVRTWPSCPAQLSPKTLKPPAMALPSTASAPSTLPRP